MKNEQRISESRVMEDVRRWRREAYAEDLRRSPEQRRSRLVDTCRRLGLKLDDSATPAEDGAIRK